MLIWLYFVSCSGGSNKTAAKLWDDGQKYRVEDKLKESIEFAQKCYDIAKYLDDYEVMKQSSFMNAITMLQQGNQEFEISGVD